MTEPVRYAGFWIRVFANVLDLLILGAVHRATLVASEVWLHFSDPRSGIGSVSLGIPEFTLQSGVVFPPVAIILFWIWRGATPGKMMLGLGIIDESTGGHPSAWQCIGRYFMALVALACAGIGYFYIAIDPRHQGWHDKIVRTFVVHRRRAA